MFRHTTLCARGHFINMNRKPTNSVEQSRMLHSLVQYLLSISFDVCVYYVSSLMIYERPQNPLLTPHNTLQMISDVFKLYTHNTRIRTLDRLMFWV